MLWQDQFNRAVGPIGFSSWVLQKRALLSRTNEGFQLLVLGECHDLPCRWLLWVCEQHRRHQVIHHHANFHIGPSTARAMIASILLVALSSISSLMPPTSGRFCVSSFSLLIWLPVSGLFIMLSHFLILPVMSAMSCLVRSSEPLTNLSHTNDKAYGILVERLSPLSCIALMRPNRPKQAFSVCNCSTTVMYSSCLFSVLVWLVWCAFVCNVACSVRILHVQH